ncbi:phytoene desaturase family protein [Halalkalibaculum sp. DA384]|uniref:phytoene desaturase family protein n=1 Tax=Halalkalibaculum sp. DA384 TaxID=3373606 RepID=UPI003753FB6C
MNIAVIGAGIGGLAAASLLAKDNHSVTVYEKNETVGGKMNEIRAGGFRFDTGPSLLTLPELLERLFSDCGERMEEYLQLEPLNPLCRYFFRDGTTFDNFEDQKRSLAEIARIAPEDEEAYTEFLGYAKQLFQKTSSSFLFNPLFDISDLSEVNLADLARIDAVSTVSARVDKYFQSDYLRRFFKRFATYNGSSPFQAPATLNVIPHVEINRGGYYVKDGIYRIAEALAALAKKNGARFIMDTEVTAINTERGRVRGIELYDGTKEQFDIVLSNSDASETYLHLLPDRSGSSLKKKIIANTEPSCSGFVLLLGLDRSYNQLRHHNVFFSDSYEKEFEAIFKDRVPAKDPTIYIANTSYSDPGHAIAGGSNLFVLVNAPYLSERYDWSSGRAAYARHIKQVLESRGLTGLGASIRYEKIITPQDFYQKYRSNKGSIYGTSSNSRMAAFMRPANKARNVEGLYLTGGSTHPGGGIPLVILSAMHACELINRYEV